MATMKEIADMAGVSQATVSRVLNGSTLVSTEKRALVMECVRKLDYTPNYSAQILASKRSFLLGIIIPDIINPYFSRILQVVEGLARQQGYSLILNNSMASPGLEREILQTLKARQADGVLVVPGSIDSPIVSALRNSSLPSVMITRQVPGFDSVSVSHSQGGRLVAQHISAIGKKRMLFVGPEGDEKILGFRKELQSLHLDDLSIALLPMEPWDLETIEKAHSRALSYFSAEYRPKIDVVFASNDITAFGVVHALNDLGIKIPDEIAVIGFDNTFLTEGSRPTLSSVAQPVEEIARCAFDLLLRKIEGSEEKRGEAHIELAPRLVPRASSLGEINQ